MKFIITIIALALAGCGSTADFKTSVDANVQTFKLYNDAALAAQRTLIACYEHNPNKSECSILAASTNAVQTLAGRPDAIRTPRTNAEVAGDVTGKVVDATVTLGVATVVGGALKDGFDAAAKDPVQVRTQTQVVRPEIVRPEVILVPGQ
jgi:hypothetical protein